jgi:hypothetical protein
MTHLRLVFFHYKIFSGYKFHVNYEIFQSLCTWTNDEESLKLNLNEFHKKLVQAKNKVIKLLS